MERNTIQRRAIHRALEAAGRPLGPPEIFRAAKADAPGLGIATVYRTVKHLLDEGWLAPVSLPGATPRYELAGKKHHHYFLCTGCDRVFDVDGCPAKLDTLTPCGFHLEGHHLVLYGRCKECSA